MPPQIWRASHQSSRDRRRKQDTPTTPGTKDHHNLNLQHTPPTWKLGGEHKRLRIPSSTQVEHKTLSHFNTSNQNRDITKKGHLRTYSYTKMFQDFQALIKEEKQTSGANFVPSVCEWRKESRKHIQEARQNNSWTWQSRKRIPAKLLSTYSPRDIRRRTKRVQNSEEPEILLQPKNETTK